MANKSITIELPEALYESVQAFADVSKQPIEVVMLDTLKVMFDDSLQSVDVETALQNIQNYTDVQLWGIVNRWQSPAEAARRRELSAKAKQVPLTDDEQAELNQLLDQLDRFILLRSKALLYLKQHGQPVDAYLQLATQRDV